MTFIAFGNHTVRNLLCSPYFRFKKIVLCEKYRQDRELLKILASKKVPVSWLDKGSFTRRYSLDKKTQGIVVFIKDYNYISLSNLLVRRPRRNFPLIIMLDSIEDPHNFGAILRTAAALDIDGIIIAKRNQVPVNNTVIKISMGGAAYIPVCQENNLGKVIEKLKEQEYKIIATVCDPQAQKYHQLKFDAPTCLILGSEHKGISPNLIKKSNQTVYIPMSNNIASLNVSVSCGIILSKLLLTKEGNKT